MKIKFLCLLLLAAATSYGQAKKTATQKPAATAKPATASGDGLFAEISTLKGKILLQLEFEKTPVTIANFVSLAEGTNPMVTGEKKGKPFYDGLKFHRVIADFMIQGGDPAGNGSGGPGYKLKDEITDLKHNRAGTLSMANSGPATNGSQFFITHKETAWLDGKHTVFGYVVTGQDVVNAIAQNDVIDKITIIRKGAAAKAFNAPKIFADYFAQKDAMDAKEKAEKEAAAAATKKAYEAQYGGVISAKKAEFDKIKTQGTTLPSGVVYKITKKGAGPKPAEGQQVFIHYAGYFTDGTLFDSSYADVNKAYGKYDERREQVAGYAPFPFNYGNKTGLIQGFLEGLNAMELGDKAVIFIPSALGYGARGAGDRIPPNSDLVFELELLEKGN